jgi:hypothetical protein
MSHLLSVFTDCVVLMRCSLTEYNLAFRTMNVLTDVFCSAGIALPDSSGRILNVGGWAAQSLQGVRLYTPSGEPGVNGTTDWQEDVANVALQVRLVKKVTSATGPVSQTIVYLRTHRFHVGIQPHYCWLMVELQLLVVKRIRMAPTNPPSKSSRMTATAQSRSNCSMIQTLLTSIRTRSFFFQEMFLLIPGIVHRFLTL